ncbi:hypothetical protein [Lonepinella koalarum]
MSNLDKIIEREYKTYIQRSNAYYDNKNDVNFLLVKESEKILKILCSIQSDIDLNDDFEFLVCFLGFLGRLNNEFK